MSLSAEQQKYLLDHAVCPVCKRDDFESTTLGYFGIDDPNLHSCCYCGWQGMRFEMLPLSEIFIDRYVVECSGGPPPWIFDNI